MISYAEITTAPTETPVSIGDLKSHAIIDHTGDDILLLNYRDAVIAELDPPHGILGRAMMTQTVKAYLKEFPGDSIELPFPPLVSVTSVKYKDSDDAEQTVDSSTYEVTTGSEPGYITILDGQSWPTSLSEVEHPIWIEYVAGYSTAKLVPAGIKHYIMMMVAEMYRERELSTMAQTKPNVMWRNMIERYRFHFSGWDE